MKLIPLKELVGVKTADLIKAMMEQAPAPALGQPGGLDMNAVFARRRVLRALRVNTDPARLLLEDADHATLLEAAKTFRYGMATEELGEILEDISDAKEPPAIVQPAPAPDGAAAPEAPPA